MKDKANADEPSRLFPEGGAAYCRASARRCRAYLNGELDWEDVERDLIVTYPRLQEMRFWRDPVIFVVQR